MKTTSEDSSPKPQNISLSPIAIVIQGLGHVPSFKNSKMLCRGRLITDPKKQKWMKAAVHNIASQLNSLCQTTEPGISTEELQRSLIASLPQDDNCKVITEIHCRVVKVPKGEEGAVIIIKPGKTLV